MEITELPLRVWTQTYKEQLESWMAGTDKTAAFVKDYREYHTDTAVHFVVTMTEDNMQKAEEEGLEKRFKMTSQISLSNMVCFDHHGRIKRYASPLEILREYFEVRLKFYHRRKVCILSFCCLRLRRMLKTFNVGIPCKYTFRAVYKARKQASFHYEHHQGYSGYTKQEKDANYRRSAETKVCVF